MKNILFFVVFMTFICAAAFAQNTFTLTFTGKGSGNVYRKLDSVKVVNLNRNWSETIVNDTVFTLTNHVGINDFENNSFGLVLGVNNSSEGKTEVLLNMPESGKVGFELYDISGRKLASSEENLSVGTHSFFIEMQKSQICFLRAICNNGIASVKMQNLGNGSKNAIVYKSLNSETFQLKYESVNYFEAGDSMQYIGYTTYNDSVYYSEPITKSQMSDEELILMFDICYVVTNEFSETACDIYTWNGTEYTESGDYEQTFTAVNGCDSVVTLHLTINQPVASEITETSCGTYTWNAQTYETSGDYEQTFTAVNGCDSVVTLHLVVNQSVIAYDTIDVIDSLVWNGSVYKESGDYIDTLLAANGCDSIVNLHLFVQNKIISVNGVDFRMIAVDGGTFNMGNANGDDDEKPVHSVELDSFFIGETEVTQKLWMAVVGYWPGIYPSAEYGLGDSLPAYYLNYSDIADFITLLNDFTGLTFRLPTEAEWEYAARGGALDGLVSTLYSGSGVVDNVAWYLTNSNSLVHAVKKKLPNELGVYDMSGNVYEWCSDLYGETYYSSSPSVNPTGPATGTSHVLRGGCYTSGAENCSVANRYVIGDLRIRAAGFRLVLDN